MHDPLPIPRPPYRTPSGPPVGPLTDRQRRLEAARQVGMAVTRELDNFFGPFLAIRPQELTSEQFASLQSGADELREEMRKLAQVLYDQIEAVSNEEYFSAEELLAVRAELAQAQANRIHMARMQHILNRLQTVNEQRQQNSTAPRKP